VGAIHVDVTAQKKATGADGEGGTTSPRSDILAALQVNFAYAPKWLRGR
jgi:hypothetical protein